MSKQFLHMQKLAGLITESKYKKLVENENNPTHKSKVDWYYINDNSDYPGPKGRTVPDAKGFDNPKDYKGTELYIAKGTKGWAKDGKFEDEEGNDVGYKEEYFEKLNEVLNESELRNKIKELVQSTLGEAKKKKKEADVAPQEDIDLSAEEITDEAPAEDTLAPASTDEIDIDPKVKTIQDSLSKALANAKALGDEKLVNQIGNTITMLVRTQVVGQQVAENINEYADGAQFYVNLLKDYLDDEEDLNNLIKAIEIIKTNFQSLEEIEYESADFTRGYDTGYQEGYRDGSDAASEEY